MAEGKSNFGDIDRYIQGLQYPADRRDVIEAARRNGAPEEFMRRLEAMPSGKFHSLNNVHEHMGHAETAGAGARAEAGRSGEGGHMEGKQEHQGQHEQHRK